LAEPYFTMADLVLADVSELGWVDPNDALEKVRGEMEALEARDLLPLNLEVGQLVVTGFGVMEKVKVLRERAAGELAGANLGLLERFGLYVGALMAAEARLSMVLRTPNDGLEELVEAAMKARETLMKDAAALAQRGLINGGELARVGERRGRMGLWPDLVMLCGVLNEHWPAIEGKCAIVREELVVAEQMALRLARLLGCRAHRPTELRAATDTRVRAFTLYMRAYAEARSVSQFLCRLQPDVQLALPSLYRRSRRKRGAEAANSESTIVPHAPDE
jgi:hypothetical protein